MPWGQSRIGVKMFVTDGQFPEAALCKALLKSIYALRSSSLHNLDLAFGGKTTSPGGFHFPPCRHPSKRTPDDVDELGR